MTNFIKLLESKNVRQASFKKGEKIYFEEDVCQTVDIVANGHVRISSITSLGQEIIYKDLLSGDMFGQNLIFSNNPRYRGDVIAMEDSEIISITKSEFINVLSENKLFLEEFLHYQSEDSKRLNQTIKILSVSTAEEKLLYLLKINNGEIKIKSITDLSKKLNITRESTSRIVHQLIKNKKISFDKNVICAK